MRPGWAPEESGRAVSLPTSSLPRGARTPAGSMLSSPGWGGCPPPGRRWTVKEKGGESGGVVSRRVGKESWEAPKTEFRGSGFPGQGKWRRAVSQRVEGWGVEISWEARGKGAIVLAPGLSGAAGVGRGAGRDRGAWVRRGSPPAGTGPRAAYRPRSRSLSSRQATAFGWGRR